MTEAIVELKNVSFRYGPTSILEHIDLHFHRGQIVGILGPSGAGKTTLLKIMLGLNKPVEGTVRIAGEPLNGQPSKRIGYVPQVETVDWNFPVSVEQAVMMGRTMNMGLLPWPSAADRKQAYTVMEQLGIAQFAKRHIRQLSGGQQQRVFLARALISKPDLLVLDEPTAGVDMHTQEEILHLLADLNKSGVTIVMTTHDLNAAAAHMPWIVCLNRTVIAQGMPDAVMTPEVLNKTYRGDMIVVKQDGLIFVQERPHWHSHHELVPNPVLTHPLVPVPPTLTFSNDATASAPESQTNSGQSVRTL